MRCARTCVAGALAAIALGGCSADLKQQAALLTQENQDLRKQLAARNDQLALAQVQLQDQESRLAELERSLDPAQAPLAQVTGFENIPNVSASVGGGEVTVEVASDVLFSSGKSSLRSEARTSLDAVVSVLNRSYPNREIRVIGHTDSDPIRRSGYKSNYHLGFERAYAVRDYLISRGVAADRISLASYGPDRPQGTKASSRRVEIVVVQE